MKCKCGNELGKPLVNPRPIVFKDIRGKEQVLYFMAGFVTYENGYEECYFCYKD